VAEILRDIADVLDDDTEHKDVSFSLGLLCAGLLSAAVDEGRSMGVADTEKRLKPKLEQLQEALAKAKKRAETAQGKLL